MVKCSKRNDAQAEILAYFRYYIYCIFAKGNTDHTNILYNTVTITTQIETYDIIRVLF